MSAIAPSIVKQERVRTLSSVDKVEALPGGVVYWMSRDQRVQDNWALLYAKQRAEEAGVPLSVVFCLVPSFLEATIRQYGFMLRGLEEVETELTSLDVPFVLLQGWPSQTLPAFLAEHQVAALVTDFSPLRVPVTWKNEVVAAQPSLPVFEVDAHNVVPVWKASDKKEVGARTIRKKITDKLPEYLTELPKFVSPANSPAASITKITGTKVDWVAVKAGLSVDRTVREVEWCTPGSAAALKAVEEFCSERLKIFAEKRNDPNVDAASNLSPYLHFGQLGAQRMALMVKEHHRKHSESVKSFLEESVVRRELADNFCFYQPHYDSLEGAAGWAQDSLRLHETDKREHVYSLEELEGGKTHEDIWNAAQRQMVRTGKMHGFMRMYWAKKILEWSPTPAEALRRSIYLNDRYELDGRDPNGYVGCAWSIMGTHDMGWAERAVFGKIRYMNYAGCKRKFDIKKYAAAWPKEEKTAASAKGANPQPPAKKARSS